MYEGFEEETGRVLLKMRGACSGCPSSAVRSTCGPDASEVLMHRCCSCLQKHVGR